MLLQVIDKRTLLELTGERREMFAQATCLLILSVAQAHGEMSHERQGDDQIEDAEDGVHP